MQGFRYLLPLTLAASLGACAGATYPQGRVIGTASILNASGSVVGNAVFSARGDTLSLKVEAAGLTPGEHGMHLHATGRCIAGDFSSASAHLNPTNRQHGQLNAQGSHLGDLPNLAIGENGRGAIDVPLPGTRDMLTRALFDADGTAIVIHANADDYRTDPSGNSGGRIACGVLASVR